MSTVMEMLERVRGGEDASDVIQSVKEGADVENKKDKDENQLSLRERAERFLRSEQDREGEE